MGPPESVTVSIIIDNDFRQCFPTSFSSFSNSQDQNEDDVINKEKAEDDDEEDERVVHGFTRQVTRQNFLL